MFSAAFISVIIVTTKIFQLVTYQTLRRFIFALWGVALFVTALPLLGFGLYHKEGQCARYREATELTDQVYAYFFMTFGKYRFSDPSSSSNSTF